MLGLGLARLVGGEVEAGRHAAVMDGDGLPSGTCVVWLVAGEHVSTQRVTFVR